MAVSLFTTIGGRETILAAVNAFYRRVIADPNLSPFFESSDVDHLVARQAMFLTMLLGGGPADAGITLRNAHAPSRTMGLNDSHFDAFLIHFRAALAEVDVPPENVAEIIARLEYSRAAVLGR